MSAEVRKQKSKQVTRNNNGKRSRNPYLAVRLGERSHGKKATPNKVMNMNKLTARSWVGASRIGNGDSSKKAFNGGSNAGSKWRLTRAADLRTRVLHSGQSRR